MSKISVGEGQMVDKQTILKKIKSTNNSTKPHLHLEVRRGGKLVNPSDYVEFAK
jgi:murein DD-endopeptidase MepM/ murein hydrolase activator NlpD